MASDTEKQRARWKRNKRAARNRVKLQPRPLDPEFERRAVQERDHRVAAGYAGAGRWPEAPYLFGNRLARAVKLAADVWLAVTLYEAQWGVGSVTTSRLCELLKRMKRDHGYSEGSLRKMVPKARERVRFLETHGEPWTKGHLYWRPFDAGDRDRLEVDASNDREDLKP